MIPPDGVFDFVYNTPGPRPSDDGINCMKEGNGLSGTTNYSCSSELLDRDTDKLNRHFLAQVRKDSTYHIMNVATNR